MSAFIDRLAKAAWYDRYPESLWDGTTEVQRETWRGHIRSILTEMREAVTPEMTGAMWKVDCPLKAGMIEVFQAAIDHALKEGQ